MPIGEIISEVQYNIDFQWRATVVGSVVSPSRY
jgi:hypothetical protein